MSDAKIVKTECLPPFDYYSDRALFMSDNTVEVVSYKGEGEDTFDTVADFEDWKKSKFRKYF